MTLKTFFKLNLLFLAICPYGLFSQNTVIKGIVVDTQSNKPLPFVNIVYNTKNEGLITEMDGSFSIDNSSKIEFLKFTYVGYQPVIFSKNDLAGKTSLAVKMKEKTFNIDEVTVFPGENPAHRIIKAVVKSRKKNNPEKLASFKYKSYHKMYFTAEFDKKQKQKADSALTLDSSKVDSGYIRAQDFLSKQHMFLMESVSERSYKKPGKVYEKVLASRVSGFKEPSMVMLATQMQSFSFYDEIITLLDSRYVNPISKGSTNRYFFNIEDTTFTKRGDTVFSISYRPKKGRNFEGLKGLLNINSHGYAIQNVVAEPIEEVGIMNIRIHQNYELIENEHWFPKELNTDIVFSDKISAEAGEHKMKIIGVGKSYIDEVELNKEIKNSTFSAIEVDIDRKAFNQNDSIWDQYRKDSLSKRELRTYEFMDSVGKEHKLDLKLKLAKTLFKGYIPYHFLDIGVLDLLNFNMYEGFRPGLRIKTNDRFSKFFSVGGYGAYGFKDVQWKYGGNIDFNIAPKQEFKIGFAYQKDVEESSGYEFMHEPTSLNTSEYYRIFLFKDMTYKEGYTSHIEFRTLKHWKVKLLANQFVRKNTSGYYFTNNSEYDEPKKEYKFQEAGIQLKYAPNDKKAFIAGELFSTNPVSSPVLYLNFIKGFKNPESEFEYTKLEAELNVSFLTKSFGRTNLQIVGGKAIGDLPYFMLYNGHGSYYDFNVETANSFQTMRMNEFLSDEFVSVHFRQDFGSLLFKTKKFKPVIIACTSVGYGQLEKPGLHNAIDFKTMDQGFLESGLVINELIPYAKIAKLGFGVFYRYGTYSFSNNSDNFAYKLTLTFKL